jgi:hypothetical protein
VSGAVRFAKLVWPADAERLGFSSNQRGERVRNGSALRAEGSWLELRARAAARHRSDLLGTPGLWRELRERSLPRPPAWVRVFDLPPLLSPEAWQQEGEEHPCAALLEWAEATADGSAPRGWTPPARNEVEAWIGPARRSVRAGAHVAQLGVVIDPMRSVWLEELCQDVQERWRMVRFGVDRAAAVVRGEVDLTGAPAERARPLVELGLAVLSCSAQWALPSLSLVANPALRSRALDHQPRWVSARLSMRGETQ